MRKATPALLFLFLVPVFALAQQARDSWDNLKQLRPGQKIEIVDMKMKSLKGEFISFTDEAIVLRERKAEQSVARADVSRVSSRQDSKRARNMLIGLAIGAGVGVAIGAAMDARVNYERGECCLGMGFGALTGAGAGLGIGAASPGYRTVYRAKK
jgi:hypothetical protein